MSEGPLVCDVLVIGAGAGGLTCAITASLLGLDVQVVEKAPVIGGTTALSGGWLWIPCSPHARAAGVDDSIDEARRYLQHELGDRYESRLIDAYLESGPRMLAFLEANTALRFFLGTEYPDYHPDQPGARSGGRSVCAMPMDGRALGPHIAKLREPVREMTLFGLKVGSGPDFRHFFQARRSPRSALYVGRRVASHVRDRLLHGRDLSLMSGNALVGRLLQTLVQREIPLWLDAPAIELIFEDGRVAGAIVEREGNRVVVRTRKGVVCASGGFGHDRSRRRSLLPQGAETDAYSLTVREATGDGLRLGQSAGGNVYGHAASAAAWMPVSVVPRRDGSKGLYPHSFDRGKPGMIAVDSRGTRFVNEGDSYHDFVVALLEREPETGRCWFVADAAFVSRYGLGMAKPFPIPKGHLLESGYLLRAPTIEGLARAAGIDPNGLARTVERFNREARQGLDTEFGRGTNAYHRYQGDREHSLHPSLAPIVEPPFYAVAVHAGDLATFAGLVADEHARVLDARGQPIPGLYAVGTDMASPFRGIYMGPGANLGPAMTFGYRCAHHLAGRAETQASR